MDRLRLFQKLEMVAKSSTNLALSDTLWQVSKSNVSFSVLPDSAIYRQFRDFEGYVGDEFFAKIACDFSVKFRDFKELAIFGNFSAISGQNSAIFAIFEPHL